MTENQGRHQGIVRKGAWGFFYPECSCGWARTDGFASEQVAVQIVDDHVAQSEQSGGTV